MRIGSIVFALVLVACGSRTGLNSEDIEASLVDADTIDGPLADATKPDGPEPPPVKKDASSCSQSKCFGCCDGDECVEVIDLTPQRCGIDGVTCKTCPRKDDVCFKGACMHDQPDCGPTNCPGCCITHDKCLDGVDNYACGNDGEMCQSCHNSSKPTCDALEGGGGACGGTPSCGPSCFGCCDGDVCKFGDTNDACGAKAQTCKKCLCISLGLNQGGKCNML